MALTTTKPTDIESVKIFSEKYQLLLQEIQKVIIGQKKVIKELLLSIFCNSHSLIIGVPGLAKTLLVKTIAETLDLSFNRIQFTPDLMPSDILGAEILNKSREFEFLKGPVFSNIVLADEINRTPPKTQSALLEAMQEKKITVGGNTYSLPQPFFVLATQNPIEQEGTYPLPEAQLDRFMFNILVEYPSFEEEINIVKQTHSNKNINLKKILHSNDILYFQSLVDKIPITDNLIKLAVELVKSTRPEASKKNEIALNYISWGAGPRASQFLIKAAKAHALINGKISPDFEDLKTVAFPILRHRIVTNYKAEAENINVSEIITQLIDGLNIL